MKHVCDGLGNKEIAEKTGRSVDTIRAFLRRAFSKLGAANRTSAAVIYATKYAYTPGDVETDQQMLASERAIESWADPAMRAKRIAGMRRRWTQH